MEARHTEDAGRAGWTGVDAAVPAVTDLVPEPLTTTRSIRSKVPCAAVMVTFPPVTEAVAPATLTVPAATASVMSPLVVTAQPETTPLSPPAELPRMARSEDHSLAWAGNAASTRLGIVKAVGHPLPW